MDFKYEGAVQISDEHDDHEFTDGDPCKLYRLTQVNASGTWYGNILTSPTPDGEFNHEQGMPRDMVEKLKGILAQEKEIESAGKFRAEFPQITNVIARLLELANTHPHMPIGQALEHHSDIKAVAEKYLDLPRTLGMPSDDMGQYAPLKAKKKMAGVAPGQ